MTDLYGGLTPDQWRKLETDLAELEASDPEVKAARERLDEAMTPHEVWRRRMVRDVWGESE